MSIIKWYIFWTVFIVTNNTFCEGFVAGTLVKTNYGYTPIEKITVGTKIYTQNKKGKKRKDAVLYTYRARVPFFICLHFNNQIVSVASDQQFYIFSMKKWVSAMQLVHCQSYKKAFIDETNLLSIEIIQKPVDVYLFTTKKYHTFFISQNMLLVHNIEPLYSATKIVSSCAPILFESTLQVIPFGYWGCLLAVACFGGLAIYDFFVSKKRRKQEAKELQKSLDKSRKKQLEKEYNQNMVSSGGPQKDPNNKKKNSKDSETENTSQKKRIENTITVSEAKKCDNFKKYFTHDKCNRYRVKKDIKIPKHLKGVEYIEWDHLHNE